MSDIYDARGRRLDEPDEPTPLSDADRIRNALSVLYENGQVDGAHHKAWVIDQVARELLQDGYEAWVPDYCKGDNEDDDDEYEWDEGIAP